jgi:Tfp pilus assembly PilM family ATPase
MQDAEMAKYEIGLTGPNDAVTAILKETVRPLVAEIRSSINYFASGTDGTRLERISLTGGASALLGFGDILATQIGVPTNVVTPMQHIRNRWASKEVRLEDSERSASAVSVGLAMGAAA